MTDLIQILNNNKEILLIAGISLSISVIYTLQYFIRLILSKRKAKQETGYLMQIIPPKYSVEEMIDKRGLRFSLQRFIDNLTASVKDSRISFEIFADSTGIKLLVWTPTKRMQELIKLSLYTTYNERIKIKVLGADPLESFSNSNAEVEEYKNEKHDVYMLMDVKDFESLDPVNDLLGSMIGLKGEEKMYFQLVLKPAKLDKVAFKKAKENFRLGKSEVTWLSILLQKFEAYFIYLIPLLPVIIFNFLSIILQSIGNQSTILDPVRSLSDSDPRKVLIQTDELSDFNKRINEKFKTSFSTYIRVSASGMNAMERLDAIEQAMESMKSETHNRLKRIKRGNMNDLKSRFIYPEDDLFPMYKRLFTSQISLCSREISMLYHLPDVIFNPAIEHYVFQEIPAKKSYRVKSDSSDLLLGINTAREKTHKVYLGSENRKRHMVITGQTGTGKSTIMKNFILQDIDNRLIRGIKRGLILMDPHEDFFMDILRKLPKGTRASNILIPWDTRSTDMYFGYNPIYSIDLNEREIDLTVDSNYKLIEKLIKRIDPEAGMGATGKPMLINAMKTLMIFQLEFAKQYPERLDELKIYAPTLADIMALFSDDRTIRENILNIINVERYESLRNFWQDVIESYEASRSWNEIRMGFNNKIQHLLTGVLLYTFGQSQNSINISDVIKSSRILLVNLSSKNIGEEGMNLLGSFLISKIWFEAKRIEKQDRRQFSIYADEFQNFANKDFSTLLSESRKFGIELILAHQFYQQLPEDVYHAVTGNVKTKIYYRSGVEDADIIAKELQGKVLAKEVIETPEFHANVKVGEDIFSINVPKERDDSLTQSEVEKLVNDAYLKYAKPKEVIENEIKERREWLKSLHN